MENRPYDDQPQLSGVLVMPKRKPVPTPGESFGERLARLRHEAGYSQRDLAAETGISYRMIAYYEKETTYPPTHLLPRLGKALGVSADALLGMERTAGPGRRRDNRLWRRFSQVEKLPPGERKRIVQLIDDLVRVSSLRRAE